jgi:hypothetical protein
MKTIDLTNISGLSGPEIEQEMLKLNGGIEMDSERQVEECRKEIQRLRQVVREYEGDKVRQAAPDLYEAVQWALAQLSNPNAIDPAELGFKLLRALKAAGADETVTIPACAGIIKSKELALLEAAPDLLAVCQNLSTCMDNEPNGFHPAFVASCKMAISKAEGKQ